jgi:hypothetical protein
MKLKIQNNFITNLPADPDLENSPRQSAYVVPFALTFFQIHANGDMATKRTFLMKMYSFLIFKYVFRNSIYPNTQPFVWLCGHQFGQLGDGAINLTEVVHEDKTYTYN